MIWVNGKLIEQEHFSAGELKIKLFGCGMGHVDIVWHYENDAENNLLHLIWFLVYDANIPNCNGIPNLSDES